MKFLCVECDKVMTFEERQLPGDGTLTAVFRCPSCGRMTAMLTNPMETQLVSSLGVTVGGRTVPQQPLELVRTSVTSGREDAFEEAKVQPDPEGAEATVPAQAPDRAAATVPAQAAEGAVGPVTWSDDAVERLNHVPSFVRGMVRRIYGDYAEERGIAVITPEVMDRARQELGLEEM